MRGMSKNVFFMSHEHRETGGGEDSVSKHNAFEVKPTVPIVFAYKPVSLGRNDSYIGPLLPAVRTSE